MKLLVYTHLFGVVSAILLLLYIFFVKKGTRGHLIAGRMWVVSMCIAAYSSLFIRTEPDGSFSYIHIFSVTTILCVIIGIQKIRNRVTPAHMGYMIGTAFGGLGVAGILAFLLPGRLLNRLVFGG